MWKPKKSRVLTLMVRSKSSLDILAAEEGWKWYKGDINVDEDNPLYILMPRKLGYFEACRRIRQLMRYGIHCCILCANDV